jgi:hypothetical protein
MDERLQFILDAQSHRFTMAALCARYGISCRNGYTWLARAHCHTRGARLSHSWLIPSKCERCCWTNLFPIFPAVHRGATAYSPRNTPV